MPEVIDFHCLGCGRHVCRAREGATLAISCACGAMAPVLLGKDGALQGLPASLVHLLRSYVLQDNEARPHLEYYLGFSDHHSPEKERMETVLRALGCIPQGECPDPKCRQSYRRTLEEWNHLMARQARLNGPKPDRAASQPPRHKGGNGWWI